MNSWEHIDQVLTADGGVLLRRDHPELADALKWLVRRQCLVAVFPGVYVRLGALEDWRVRALAVARYLPEAVLTGAAAARLAYSSQQRLDVVQVAVVHDVQSRPGYKFSRRRVPSELVVERNPFRFTSPSLTALDLCTLEQTEAIDEALRKRVTTLSGLRRALELTPGRPGNVSRRLVVLDSRDGPWSHAERHAHRLLRAAGISGWRANVPLRHASSTYYLDIAFSRVQLAIEIDGRLHEEDHQLFESDRWRQNALVLSGWRVLRFTYRMLVEAPEVFVRAVKAALAG